MIIVPEIILLNTIKGILRYIRQDYQSVTNKSDSFLLQLLQGLGVQRYFFEEQVVEVLISDKSSPRYLDVNLFFNMNRANLPTIHIIQGDESPAPSELNTGIGNVPNIVDTTNKERVVLSRRQSSRYDLVITSNNTNEVVMLYSLFKSLLVTLIPHLELTGLHNIKISGSDLPINTQLIPSGIFGRRITLDFEYYIKSLSIDNVNSNIFINFNPITILNN